MRFFILCLLLNLALPATVNATNSISIISDSWPPYVTEDPAQPGIDVETAIAVFEQLGYVVNFQLVPWKRAQVMVHSGKADTLLDASINETRLSQFWFPKEPLSYSVTTLFCKRCDLNAAITPELLDNGILIINRGYSYASDLAENSSIERIKANSIATGFELLRIGRGDFYLLNRRVGLYMLDTLGISDIAPMIANTNEPSPLYLAFSQQPQLKPLVEQFSTALRQFKQSEQYRAILHRYGIQP